MAQSSKFSDRISLIASIIGIIAFFGYPTIQSILKNENEINKNPTSGKSISNDYNLIGSWQLREGNVEYELEETLKFKNDGTGKLNYKIKRKDALYESESVCPFRWKTKRSELIMDTIVINYGISEVIYAKWEPPFGPVYDIQKKMNSLSYDKRNDTMPYIWQGSVVYFESSTGKNIERLKFQKLN